MKQITLIPHAAYRIIITGKEEPIEARFQGLVLQGLMFEYMDRPLCIALMDIEYINPVSDRKPLEEFVEAEAKALSERLAEEEIREVKMGIKVSGRSDGDLRISYSIGNSYESDFTESHSLGKAIEEFIRRNQFNRGNNPLLITKG